MSEIPDRNIPHEAGVDAAVDDQLARTSSVPFIANAAVAATSPPTKTEYDALVGKFNQVLTVLKDAELIPSS